MQTQLKNGFYPFRISAFSELVEQVKNLGTSLYFQLFAGRFRPVRKTEGKAAQVKKMKMRPAVRWRSDRSGFCRFYALGSHAWGWPYLRIVFSMLFTVLFISACASNQEGVYYVSPDGSDEAAGTETAPWQTLGHVSKQAKAGDTIVLMDGRYDGVFEPANSGEPGAPITLKAQNRLMAHLTGQANGSEPAVQISGVSHIRVEGLRIHDPNEESSWVRVEDAEDVEIRDCAIYMSIGTGLGFTTENVDNVRILDNVVRGQRHNMMQFRMGTKNVLVEGNVIGRAGHSPFMFYPPQGSERIVVRGNVFLAEWGRSFEFFSTDQVLFENNLVTRSYDGGRSAGAGGKILTADGIFRYNEFRANRDGVVASIYSDDLYCERSRLYNNVFTDNLGLAIRLSGRHVDDVVVSNNLFANHGAVGCGPVLGLRRTFRGQMNEVTFNHNLFGFHCEDGVVNSDGDEQATLTELEQASPRPNEDAQLRFIDNREVVMGEWSKQSSEDGTAVTWPGELLDAMNDGGRFLTRARGAGEGRELPVDDALWFYDGFDIDGEQGDRISVGEPGRQARIEQVNAEENVLILDRTLSWQDGDPVSLPWGGQRPNIGVKEQGSYVRPSLHVRVDSRKIEAGGTITLEAEVLGDWAPQEFEWMVGEQRIETSRSTIEVSLEEADTYGIRVRGRDAATGLTAMGTEVVEATDPEAPEGILMHTSFDLDDDEWFWRWQMYRPGNASYQRILFLEEEPERASQRNWTTIRKPGDGQHSSGTGFLQVVAPEDGTRMPFRVMPEDWDIGSYSQLSLSYRIQPGTPTSVHVEDHGGDRLYLAATGHAEQAIAPQEPLLRLEDDGRWHEVTIDLSEYDWSPLAGLIKGLYIEPPDSELVTEGDQVELGGVMIHQ